MLQKKNGTLSSLGGALYHCISQRDFPPYTQEDSGVHSNASYAFMNTQDQKTNLPLNTQNLSQRPQVWNNVNFCYKEPDSLPAAELNFLKFRKVVVFFFSSLNFSFIYLIQCIKKKEPCLNFTLTSCPFSVNTPNPAMINV